jgi:hypothetical protein
MRQSRCWPKPGDNQQIGRVAWQSSAMRWDDLFADLEAQLAAAETATWRGELADRSRAELGRVALVDRLVVRRQQPLTVAVRDTGALRGRLLDVGYEWLMIEDESQRTVLVPAAACLWLTGLGRAAEIQSERSVARRLGLTTILRTLAQQRISVTLTVSGDLQITGTIDRVQADHLDLAEHPADQPRRAGDVLAVRTVPFAAIALVRPA